MPDLQTHRRRYAILLLLLCPIAAFVLMPHPQDLSVTKRAKKLVAISDWFPSRLAGSIAYQWLSPQKIVVMHSHGRIGIVDTVTGKEEPPENINGALRRYPALESLATTVPSWLLSPDGKWMLTMAFTGGQPEWVAIAMDGSRIVEAPTPNMREPVAFWDRDSQSFYQVVVDRGHVYLRRYPLSGALPPASNAIGSDPTDSRLNVPPYRFDNPFVPMGEFSPHHILMANFGGRGQPRCLIFNLKTPMIQQRADITMPEGAFVGEMELAPDGRHIGWILDFAEGMTDPVLHRLPFTPVGPGHGNNEVWVSNLDGSGMHPVATPGVEKDATGPTNLRWTPDSQNVSFVYSGYLYTAPAR